VECSGLAAWEVAAASSAQGSLCLDHNIGQKSHMLRHEMTSNFSHCWIWRLLQQTIVAFAEDEVVAFAEDEVVAFAEDEVVAFAEDEAVAELDAAVAKAAHGHKTGDRGLWMRGICACVHRTAVDFDDAAREDEPATQLHEQTTPDIPARAWLPGPLV
jgi:hypothetical protein